MVPQAVLFDFDGVLAESVNVKTEAFAKLFEQEGPEVVRMVVDYHLRNGGVSRFEKFRHYYREILKRPLSDDKFNELCSRFEEMVFDGVANTPEVPGALEALKLLHDEGIPMHIVSGTPQDELVRIARIREIDGYFRSILGSPQTKSSIVRNIISEHGYQHEKTLVVGDSSTDLEAALDSGTRFVARVTEENEEYWQNSGQRMVRDLHGFRLMIESL